MLPLIYYGDFKKVLNFLVTAIMLTKKEMNAFLPYSLLCFYEISIGNVTSA